MTGSSTPTSSPRNAIQQQRQYLREVTDRLLSSTDAELLRDGRADSFGIIYDRYIHEVLGWFYRRTADAHAAADLTAETFAQALLSRHRFRSDRPSARSWLFGIARHVLSHYLRRQEVDDRARAKLGMSPVSVDPISIDRIETLVDLAPMREAVRSAMASLGPKTREAVYLRVGLDLSYAEVAARLGCSEGAARTRVARGLSRPAVALEEQP